MCEIGKRIKKRRELLGMTQEELAKKLNYKSRSSINKIEVDGRGLPQSKILELAKALETTPQYLMGWVSENGSGEELIDYFDETVDKIISFIEENGFKTQEGNFDNIIIYNAKNEPIKIMPLGDLVHNHEIILYKDLEYTLSNLLFLRNTSTSSPAPRRINVYGRIPAGVPLEAITDIIDWEDIPGDWSGNYIALQVQGDSMNPEYREGDVIIVRVQPDCESGQDCVVYVNGYDATLKRVVKQQTCIMLQPLNPTYEPKIYEYTDPEGVTILGVVVEMRRKKG